MTVTPSDATERSPRALRIAIVDDEPTVRLLVRMLVDGNDSYELVAEADHIAAGLDAIERARPEVVLLDLLLPDLGGAEALRDLDAAAPQAMVVILSALRGADEARKAFDAGAFAYLEKSLLGPALLDELTELHARFTRQLAGTPAWSGPNDPARVRA